MPDRTSEYSDGSFPVEALFGLRADFRPDAEAPPLGPDAPERVGRLLDGKLPAPEATEIAERIRSFRPWRSVWLALLATRAATPSSKLL